MHFYQQDKAIEFNALYKDIERKLNNLEKAKIDVSEERQTMNSIKNACNQGVDVGGSQMQAEMTYQEGIKQLEEIEEGLDKHTLYYNSYNSAVDFQTELDSKDISSERLALLARSTVGLIQQIQNSDTRAYESERNVVERIYRLAYNVIKSELIKEGRSYVLDWIKNDRVASSYINDLIVMDIALLDEEAITNDVIKDTLSTLKRDIKNSSYLEEGLILFLAFQDEQNLGKIESSLLEIMKDITISDERVKTMEEDNASLQQKMDSLKRAIKESRIYKDFGVAVSLVAILVGLRFGAEKAAAFIGHTEYKTYVDYFSTEVDAEKPEYPEYMKKISGFGKTTLTAYDVWRQENIFYGEYQRNIVTYNLTKVELDSLEDFASLDFSKITSRTDTETCEELDVNELYDKAIVEIIRLRQYEDQSQFVLYKESAFLFIVQKMT